MVSFGKAFVTLTILFCGQSLFAMTTEAIQQKRSQINKLIQKSGIPQDSFGIYISTGDDSESELFSLNPSKKLIPASVTKLVTAGAVLEALPPGTKFKTVLLTSQKPAGPVLKGNLYLKGGGDPSFVSETMWFLVNAFVRTGIKEIQGDIIVDDTLFDQSRYDESRQKERVDRAYDAPTGAMSFNWNSVNVFVRPGGKVGEPAQVWADPENDYIELKAKVKTGSAGTRNSVVADRDAKKNGDILVVSGSIPAGSSEIVMYKNITRPDLWAGANLKSFLRQRGISVSGQIQSGKVKSGAWVAAEAESKPIESILADMNKFSNNYVAEMLTKNLVADGLTPATLSRGMDKINAYLKSKGVEDQMTLTNPSGLTRDNRMTAKSLWSIILDLKIQFQFQPEFVTSLPIAGIDGTLKNRMKKTQGERWVRAKTGFLTGVVSLAGYAGRSDGTVLPFVMIYNGNADESRVRALFDQIVLATLESEN